VDRYDDFDRMLSRQRPIQHANASQREHQAYPGIKMPAFAYLAQKLVAGSNVLTSQQRNVTSIYIREIIGFMNRRIWVQKLALQKTGSIL
jgi:hypothetical protein